jgi:hypothetical protein
MERRPGDPIQAEDWNKAMRAIAGLAEAGAPPADAPSVRTGVADGAWVRTSPVDPAPARAGAVAIGPGLRTVAADAAFAYVACGGFQVLELSSLLAPASLAVKGQVACPNAEDLFVTGGYVYVAAGSSGLAIVDVRDPSRPYVAGSLLLAGAARGVYVAGEVAYVVSYEQGLEIVDVADKRNPRLLSRLFVELPNSVVVRQGCAFVASDDSGYCIVDASNPAAPDYLVRYAAEFSSGKSLCLRGSLAYIADEENQLLRILDVTQPAAPRSIGALPIEPPCKPTHLAVCGDALLMANVFGAQGLYVYDLAAPEAPRRVAAAGNAAWGLAAGERYVYLATESGTLETLDLRPPRLALPAGSVGIGVAAPQTRLEVRGGLTSLEQEPWRSAELAASYQEFGGGYNPVQYFRDSAGIVHLRGTLRAFAPVGAMEAGVLFTLPTGYRPEYIENHLACAGAKAGYVELFPDGKVFVSSEGHTWLSLDGITFRAFA